MRALETKIPPPIAMALLGAIVWVVARRLPGFSFPLPFAGGLGVAVALVGVWLNLYPKRAFRRAGTTVNPLTPGSATQLVTSGIYRYTRNPMYLGHSVILLGWSVNLHNAAALTAIPIFMMYIWRFQILPEERLLSVRFQDEYVAFCRQVPRWL